MASSSCTDNHVSPAAQTAGYKMHVRHEFLEAAGPYDKNKGHVKGVKRLERHSVAHVSLFQILSLIIHQF